MVSGSKIQLAISYVDSVLAKSNCQGFLRLAHVLLSTFVTGETIEKVVSLAVHMVFYFVVVATT